MNARNLFLLALAGFTGGALSQNIVIDDFKSPDANARGNWHGCDAGAGITCTWGGDGLTIKSSDTDFSFYSQFDNAGCQDVTSWDTQYVHVKHSGSSAFSIAMQQNNPGCSADQAPYPETWDIVYAADYTDGSDIYIPVSHFNINKGRAVGLAFKAFRDVNAETKLSLIEIVTALPAGRTVPEKKPTGPLYFACTRPNSIAFGIDDGSPEFAQDIMKIIDEAGIKVTFFTVGNALDNPAENFTAVYKEAAAKGHQVCPLPTCLSLPPLAQDTYIHRPSRSLCIPTPTPKSKVF